MQTSLRLTITSALAMLLCANVACVAQNGVLSNCPDFQTQSYNVHPYLRAAIKLQGLGRERAIRTMRALAKHHTDDNRLIVLCRMLFRGTGASDCRRPLIGGAAFLGGTDYNDWPSEPIEIVNGIPFLITRGYSLAGKAEPASDYLEYCIAHCAWNAERYKRASIAEAQAAANTLIASPKWKSQLSEDDKRWILAQVQFLH